MPAKLSTMRGLFVIWLVVAGSRACAGDLAVIVNPACGADSMSREEVSHLFLGRIKHLPSGLSAVVIDSLAQRDAFYRALVGRSLAEIDAYWARLRFSGHTQPPLRLDAADVLEWVARDPGAIGYIDATLVDRRVKTVLRLDD